MSATPIREGRVESTVFADNRGRVRKQNYQSWHGREEKADKTPSTFPIPSSRRAKAHSPSSGIQQAQNDSAPSPAPTTEALLARY
jgi:hypothetical protein